jgi:hypothetical protein
MKKLLVFASVLVLVSCGGGGDSATAGSSSSDGTGSTIGTVGQPIDGYSTSGPLVDNSGANTFKVLLMGNSHATGLAPVLTQLLTLGQPDRSIDVQMSPGFGFLSNLVNDGFSEQKLESEAWTHVVLQAQKYSSTGTRTYPTDAAEYWIRGSKEQGATPIMFPEHPRKDNTWEGKTLWELHTGIATRESTCVAPVGLVWDEVIFRDPQLGLHKPDGNHASDTGLILTALVFYQIITGQSVESLPNLSALDIDPVTEQVMKESVTTLLFNYTACHFEE